MPGAERGVSRGPGRGPGPGPVEPVVVAHDRPGRGVLPHRVVRPAGRQRAHRRGVPGDPQRVVRREAAVVAGALGPPAGGRVDHGVPARAGLVRVQEVADPGDHLALRLAVAGGPVRVPLDVQRAGQRLAVAGPAAAVVDEVVRLGGAGRGVRGGEVVGAADHADVVRAVVLLGEVGVAVVRPLGGLDVGPLDAAVPEVRPGDVALVAGDVHPSVWVASPGTGVPWRPSCSRTPMPMWAEPRGGMSAARAEPGRARARAASRTATAAARARERAGWMEPGLCTGMTCLRRLRGESRGNHDECRGHASTCLLKKLRT